MRAGEVVLWSARLDAGADLFARCGASLSADERARAARFVTVPPRKRFVLGRGILRDVLSRHTGRAPADLVLAYGPFGKPELRDSRLHFNLSHSGDELLIAVTDMPVGIDLEGPVAECDLHAILALGLSAVERAAIERRPICDRPRAIRMAWTRKEAWLKALGTGLASEAPSGPPSGCRLVDLALRGGFVGALATLGRVEHVRHVAWSPSP